jgi:hypothetical protein
MSEYFDGVTRGDLLGDHVAEALASAGLPGLRGLAPGMLENARDALDPRPIFAAVSGAGFPVCQQVQCPVGDVGGALVDPADATKKYVVDPVQYIDGMPTQTRWVLAYDSTGSPINVSRDEFNAQPKCYNADGSYRSDPPAGCPATAPAATAAQGVGKYALCSVVQQPTMPPSLGGGAEGFRGSEEGWESYAAAAAVLAVGGAVVWALLDRR